MFNEISELLMCLCIEFVIVELVLIFEFDDVLLDNLFLLGDDVFIVLVVDDDCSICLVLCYVLYSSGFWVEEVGDGIEVLVWLEINMVDVILMDVLMLVMDGFDICVVLKWEVCWKDIFILMIMVFDDCVLIECVFEVGVSDFIFKFIYFLVVN